MCILVILGLNVIENLVFCTIIFSDRICPNLEVLKLWKFCTYVLFENFIFCTYVLFENFIFCTYVLFENFIFCTYVVFENFIFSNKWISCFFVQKKLCFSLKLKVMKLLHTSLQLGDGPPDDRRPDVSPTKLENASI